MDREPAGRAALRRLAVHRMKYARGSATVAAATVRSRGRPTALPAPDRDHRASRRQAGVAVDRDGDVDNRANARATTNIGAAVAHNALDGRFAPVHTAHSSTTSFFGLRPFRIPDRNNSTRSRAVAHGFDVSTVELARVVRRRIEDEWRLRYGLTMQLITCLQKSDRVAIT